MSSNNITINKKGTNSNDYELLHDDKISNKNFSNMTNNILSKNLLSDTYFSKENIEMLQNMIRYNVWLKTNKEHIIGKQSETNLTIIMRSIYLQYSKNNNNNIKEQIRELDTMVVEWCVPKIVTEVKQYIGYKKDIQKPIIPMEYGKYMSSAGSKSLHGDNSIL